MTESNRLRVSVVEEMTPGTTPVGPRMRGVRLTGETLVYKPNFTTSEEIRPDRMTADPIKVGETNSGPVNTEISFPVDQTAYSIFLASAFCSAWGNAPVRDNDGAAGAIITGVTATAGTIAVTAGPAFAVGHLLRTTGFSAAGNNGLFRITTGSATAPAVGAALLTDEPLPAATARVKVVGFQGVAGDLVAVADGLTATALNFTTLGLAVGAAVKVGGTGAAFRFATEANNGWARIVGIAAGKLTLDTLPSGWATDAGAGKTLRVFFGDRIKNGVEKRFMTLERGFMGQAVPTYVQQAGMLVDQMQVNLETGATARATYTFLGLNGVASTTSLDDTPDDVTSAGIMSAAVHVGRISEMGGAIIGPNWVRSVQITLNNNSRAIEAIRGDGKVGPVAINTGECAVEVQLNTYFGSAAAYQAYLAGTPTSFSAVMAKEGQAMVWTIPRLTRTDGSPNAAGKNQDVMIQFTATASKDDLVGAHLTLDRLEYFEV